MISGAALKLASILNFSILKLRETYQHKHLAINNSLAINEMNFLLTVRLRHMMTFHLRS